MGLRETKRTRALKIRVRNKKRHPPSYSQRQFDLSIREKKRTQKKKKNREEEKKKHAHQDGSASGTSDPNGSYRTSGC